MTTTVSIPENYICSLTLDIMIDPVVDYEGNTYEREAIIDWLAENPVSPVTKNPLTVNQLIPNRTVKNCIIEWARINKPELVSIIENKNVHIGTIVPIKTANTHLELGDFYNKKMAEYIPKSITQLTFSEYWNRPIKDLIPSHITHLTFGYAFNKSIKNCIPSSVTHLTFGQLFNQSIKDCIPNSVTHLTFGNNFNKPVEDDKDSLLLKLKMSSVKSYIPNSVVWLTFGPYFSQTIGYLPNSIINLNLSENYKYPVPERLISKVTFY